MKKNKKIALIAGIVLATIAADQISKIIIRQTVEYNSWTELVGKLMVLTKVENTGAFLSMLNNLPPVLYMALMIILPLAVIVYACYYLLKKEDVLPQVIIAFSLIIGGGVGNIIDRILYSSVTDFLYFDFYIFHTGIVNLADIAVTAGFFIMVYDQFVGKRKSKSVPNETKEAGY